MGEPGKLKASFNISVNQSGVTHGVFSWSFDGLILPHHSRPQVARDFLPVSLVDVKALPGKLRQMNSPHYL
tara:strand:- start:315 stop:527 length:213 start_codon:yes stop_codon:yes gene_type:complete